MSRWAIGAVLGALAGLGLNLVWRGLPFNRRHTLADRVLPYLLDHRRPQRPAGRLGPPAIAAVFGPILLRGGGAIDRLFSDGETVHRRLLRAGLPPDVDRFRMQQVLCGITGLAIGLLLAAIGVAQGMSVILAALVPVIAAGLGIVVWDWALTRRAVRREELMLVEFPTVAEFLALAVGAGEGAVGALDRVCRLSHGELAGELRRCLADARAGASLPVALSGLADRTGLPALARFVDGLVVAMSRGTPLADVLRAQAQDVRETGRRAVMESAGKKEIGMMVPVVFMILPVTIVFAVYPGLSFLDFTF